MRIKEKWQKFRQELADKYEECSNDDLIKISMGTGGLTAALTAIPLVCLGFDSTSASTLGFAISPFSAQILFKNIEDILYPVHKKTSLTKKENALAKSVFGDELKTSEIRKHFTLFAKNKDKKHRLAADCNIKRIKFYGKDMQSDDFAKDTSVEKQAIFMHEITHKWQIQNEKNTIGANLTGRGDSYTLSSRFNFANYGCEQQATIIEDYTARFLHPNRKINISHHCKNLNMFTYDALLQKIVEDRFPQATQNRLKHQARCA